MVATQYRGTMVAIYRCSSGHDSNFFQLGLYRAILRYVGSKALLTVVNAITITTLVLFGVVAMSRRARHTKVRVFKFLAFK